jgi:hypothetical protein
MHFGTTGRLQTAGFLTLLLLAAAVGASAQDEPSGASCTLPLVVPDAADVSITLQETASGTGLLLAWPEPDDAASTCVALIDTAVVDIPMAVEGDYADRFDRTLLFEFVSEGIVGSTTANRFVCSWGNANQDRTGRIGGEINLSNTGGLWIQDAGGAWSQYNEGLPQYLPYTNIVDLAVSGDGTRFCVVSRGAQVQNDPQGVYRAGADGVWQPVAEETFGRTRRVALVAVDPDDSDRFAVGCRADGLYVTADGGASFTRWAAELDPDYSPLPANYEVTAMTWTASRLLVAVRNFGTFVSTDGGASFSPVDLEAPDGSGGYVRVLTENPGDSNHLLAGLNVWGLYESRDGGATWAAINGDMAILPSVLAVDVDPADVGRLVIGTVSQGIWVSDDGGVTWLAATTPFDGATIKPEVWDFERHQGRLLCLASGFGLLESVAGGASWDEEGDQPNNRLGRVLISTPAGLLRPTNGGGIYKPGTALSISAAQTSAKTDAAYLGLEFGLTIAFGDGSVTLPDENGDGTLDPAVFGLVCQDYQGWIVWRSEGDDPDNMTMIGRYDKNNPESCLEGFCGDDNYYQLPNCFSERRASCFDFGTPGEARFFDGDVFNGFTYYYAVTPFDFGDVSLVVDPVSLTSPLVFPARFPDDPAAEGDGNRQTYQLNEAADNPFGGGENVYVYPNPLRRGAGIAGGEGEQVIWTNLPPQSRVEVFTLAGDHIVDLPEDGSPQLGGNIYWDTRNDDNQQLASGIYIWRAIMPERGDYWGKLVIIR